MSEYIVEMGNSSYQSTSGKQLADVAREMASFDLVNVVRCRGCRYYGCYDGSMWCSRTYEQVPGGTCDYQTVEPDGFCAWGEKAVG